VPLIDSPYGAAPPISRLVEYFQNHDLTPEICAALRWRRDAYTARIGRDYAHVTLQNDLQLLDMLLWHDECDELDLAACWSERVRRDYREMSGDQRRQWMALLRHIRGDAGSKPPKAWIKEAQSRVAAVGLEDFRNTVGGWFACFRRREPLRLSVVGSHVLKGLLWYCSIARDPPLTAAALPILDAAWKPKRNLDKVMVALALLIDTMPVEEAWAALLPLQRSWGASQGQIECLAIKIAAARHFRRAVAGARRVEAGPGGSASQLREAALSDGSAGEPFHREWVRIFRRTAQGAAGPIAHSGSAAAREPRFLAPSRARSIPTWRSLGLRPTVRGSRVARGQQPRPGEQLLAQGAGPIVALVDAALL